MACKERGMALITILFALTLLMMLALVLTEKVLQASHATVLAQRPDQAMDIAAAGIAWGRRHLSATYLSSGNWHDYLATIPAESRYASTPTFVLDLNGQTVELFVRDNPDGDNNWQQDNDLQLYLLARLATAQGPEMVIEALCGFPSHSSSAGYSQLTKQTPESGPGLEPDSSRTFQLVD